MSQATDIAKNSVRIENVKERLKRFVTIDRFSPIERISYAVATAIIISLVGGILSIIYKLP